MSGLPADIVPRWSAQAEGQFFDSKSALEQRGGVRRQRKPADLARDIVETLSAMANADGGELVIGIEDDGTLSGVLRPPDKLEILCTAPMYQNNVNPILRLCGQIIVNETGEHCYTFRRTGVGRSIGLRADATSCA
jgi:Putative DNA-binding domain